MSEQTNPIEPMSSDQLMRWARQERNALMADYVRSAAFHLSSSLGSYLRYFAKLARRLSYEFYLRNVTRTLRQFDDHILADIGLRRGEIEYAVRNGRARLAARKTMANRHQRTATSVCRFLTQSGHAPAARAYAHNVFLLSDRETNCSFVPDGPAA